MSSDIRRIILAVLGGAAVIAGVLTAAVLANGRTGLAGSALSDPLGWTIPLVSLFVILGVGWLLMSQTPRERGEGQMRTVECTSCGRSVLEDWRLCPYCGAGLVNGNDTGGGAAASAEPTRKGAATL